MTDPYARVIALAALLVGLSTLVPTTHLHAQQLLGEMPLDEVRALAEEGDASAQHSLGVIHANGRDLSHYGVVEEVQSHRLAASRGRVAGGVAVGQDCSRGYRWNGSECVRVEVPPNAHIDVFGSGWDCDDGFRQASDRCERMSEAEQSQQAAQQQRFLDLLASSQTKDGGCITSPDGSYVACGGESASCRTSPDGSHVACGGESAACRTSPDGSYVACGGLALRYEIAPQERYAKLAVQPCRLTALR